MLITPHIIDYSFFDYARYYAIDDIITPLLLMPLLMTLFSLLLILTLLRHYAITPRQPLRHYCH
jgi:hypothetical protein